jgi:hypothetical protein
MSLARSWVDGYPLTIIGVSRAGFDGTDPGSSPQIRVPIMMEAQLSPQFAEFYSLKNRRGNPIIEGHVWVYINLGNNHEANRPFDEQYGSHLAMISCAFAQPPIISRNCECGQRRLGGRSANVGLDLRVQSRGSNRYRERASAHHPARRDRRGVQWNRRAAAVRFFGAD